MRDSAASVPLVRTPFVIAQSAVKPQFRGVVWDLRRRGAGGCYSPLDTGGAASSHLDWTWLGTALGAGFADAELLSHGGGGASFKAEVPLDTVVSPYLLSLGAGYAGVAAQVDSFVESGLYTARVCRLGGTDGALFAHFPCRCAPQGSIPAPQRPRAAAAHQ